MQAGVWQRVHKAVLRRLREHDQILWDRASVDAASVPAPFGGEHTGRNPTDRGKLGCKHHLIYTRYSRVIMLLISGKVLIIVKSRHMNCTVLSGALELNIPRILRRLFQIMPSK